jgi:heme-degrading monooxygenase HmoA
MHAMAVKVSIRRIIQEGKLDEVLALLKGLRMKAMNRSGYITGETLVNHYNPSIIMIISTWQALEDWIRWERSDERESAEKQLAVLQKEPAQFEVYDLGALSRKKDFLI